MIMVSLVLKLFVSSRPLNLEGVLCIYVLLFYEGQAENHLLCFSIESGFGIHLGSYSPIHHRWMLFSTVGFF
jgi:hypothetical protein